MDEGIKWTGQIEKIRAKTGRLLGVLGRAGTVLTGRSLLQLYNALVLPHLQYSLMAWGDFQESRNATLAESLLRLQKRFAGIIAGKTGRYHSEPIMADIGMLKVGDLYRQQIRIHAWKFWNGRLPEHQASMLVKTKDVHTYNTRSAGTGLSMQTNDHRSIGYRIPKEWETLSQAQREIKSLPGFKKNSKAEFMSKYRDFKCQVKDCFICTGAAPESRNAESQ